MTLKEVVLANLLIAAGTLIIVYFLIGLLNLADNSWRVPQIYTWRWWVLFVAFTLMVLAGVWVITLGAYLYACRGL